MIWWLLLLAAWIVLCIKVVSWAFREDRKHRPDEVETMFDEIESFLGRRKK